ncbi:SRPBCC family protein [Brevundimonas sp.]|uniref:SRPBCC family protein n=1 Tax=Brevundimonas sp. TaxID=1871086 RepID=UPI002FCBC57B
MTEAAKPMEDHVLVEVTVPAPADAVWAALRDPQQIKNWFGWDADSLKDEIDFIFVTHAEADEERRTVTFVGVNDRYEVEARGETSLVRVVRSAPVGEWTDVFDGMIEGWISFTQQLAFAFARHPGQTRRTLFFSGPPRVDGLGRSVLGLDAAPAPGEPYAMPLGPDADAAGQVWFTARHQIGVTVDAWGDGLLVVLDSPPREDKRPLGSTMLTLTTYGLSDTAFADLENRWKAWWDQRFENAAPHES